MDDFDDWSVVDGCKPEPVSQLQAVPKNKAKPLPAPEYRFAVDRPRSSWQNRSESRNFIGCPAPNQGHYDSHVQVSCPSGPGLAAPVRQGGVPLSLQKQVADSDTAVNQPAPMQLVPKKKVVEPSNQQFSIPSPPKRQGLDSLVRTRSASSSPIVQSLWSAVVPALVPLSAFLNQVLASVNAQQHVNRLLDTYAASTLVKYLSAVQQFLQLCTDLRLDPDNLSDVSMADALLACKLSRSTHSGMAHCSMMIKAIKWAHKFIQIGSWHVVHSALLASFNQTGQQDRRESLPFSLFVVTQWERRILVRECTVSEIILLGMLLLLLFSGLRFSDMQRTALSSLHWDGKVLGGTCWRTKTSRTGQPFGVQGEGFLSKGSHTWLFKLLTTLDEVFFLHGAGDADFMIPGCDIDGARIPIQPISYAEALFFVRRMLTLPWKANPIVLQQHVKSYTVHGLKSTLLSWSVQLQLPEDQRRLQGHHKASQASVRLYSRDDVRGSLELQKAVIHAVQQGFKPVTPLSRGGQAPIEEPDFQLPCFNKQAQDVDWKFFQFQSKPAMPPEVPLPEIIADDGESSDSASSGTSDSSEDVAKMPPPELVVDEIQGALHRNMWHVAMDEFLDSSDTAAIRTACGRHFTQSRIASFPNLQIKPGQSLCAHPGCRKGWRAVGAL